MQRVVNMLDRPSGVVNLCGKVVSMKERAGRLTKLTPVRLKHRMGLLHASGCAGKGNSGEWLTPLISSSKQSRQRQHDSGETGRTAGKSMHQQRLFPAVIAQTKCVAQRGHWLFGEVAAARWLSLGVMRMMIQTGRSVVSDSKGCSFIPHAAKDETLASRMPSGCGFLIAAGNPWPHGTRLA